MSTKAEKDELAKKSAGKAAAALIVDGMTVGLGSGSTAACFIESLIERCHKEHLKISAVATSEKSSKQALEGGIPLCDINSLKVIDITVDGADEIDQKKRMIKGGGGALLREKIIANMSNEMVVIVIPEKVVKNLGKFPLPIEVVPFAHKVTLYQIEKLGCQGSFRLDSKKQLYVTDNGNYIIDVKFSEPLKKPELTNTLLKSIPGVVETGFFFDLAGRVIVGHSNGHVDVIM